jgi:catechol 2,3-dioxygenase-like lactoylglutathione lyase family enzyme
MANVTELPVALTVKEFDQALAFYRDVLGLKQIADWSSRTAGPSPLTRAGRRSNYSTMLRLRQSTRSRPAAACPARSGSR